MSVDSPALAGWDGVALAPYLQDVTTAPLTLDNDMRVMALSQMPTARADVEPTVHEHDEALVLKASTGIGLGDRRRRAAASAATATPPDSSAT